MVEVYSSTDEFGVHTSPPVASGAGFSQPEGLTLLVVVETDAIYFALPLFTSSSRRDGL